MKIIRLGMFNTTGSNFVTIVNNGNRLRKFRKDKKLTVEELAKKIGVTTRTVESWEDNLSLPSEKNQEKLAKLYDIDKDLLIQK